MSFGSRPKPETGPRPGASPGSGFRSRFRF